MWDEGDLRMQGDLGERKCQRTCEAAVSMLEVSLGSHILSDDERK